jgi:hypothetical protein
MHALQGSYFQVVEDAECSSRNTNQSQKQNTPTHKARNGAGKADFTYRLGQLSFSSSWSVVVHLFDVSQARRTEVG